jgi:hypothetical protein
MTSVNHPTDGAEHIAEPPRRNPEANLLAHMTTAAGLAVVIESGLGSEVFEEPLYEAAFAFVLK